MGFHSSDASLEKVGVACKRPVDRKAPAQVQALGAKLEDDLMALTGLAGLEKKFPHQLSGGQQQRVALARALAPKPNLLLMDEPFSNLDITLRERLSEEVRHILKQYGTTGLLVTHNQHEAFAMADSIGVMMGGKLLQWDTARNLYFKPACRQVACFVGEGSLVRGNVIGKGKIETEMGCLDLSEKDTASVTGPVEIFIRPEGIVLDKKSACKAVLIKSHFRGPGSFHTFKLASGNLVTCMDSCPSPLELGQSYGISLCICHASIFSSPI